MSRYNYTVKTYGIALPSYSKKYKYVLEKLKTLHPDYFNDGEDEFEQLYYINDIEPNINHHHNVVIYEIESLKDKENLIISDLTGLLVLHGDHPKPTLVTSPFKSNEECIEHYRNQFNDILPKDFNYEENIGKIYVKAWD